MTSTSQELFTAIGADDLAAVQALLGAEPTLAGALDDQGVSALMRARYRMDEPMAQAVRSHVTDLDLFEAAAFADLDRLTELLAYDPASIVARSGDGFTALHFAAFFADAQVVEFLVTRGAEVDARGTGWMTGTALHSAASRRRADIAQVLLDAGADPNVRQAKGWTPLHSGAHNGSAELVRMLLDAGADPSPADDDGATPVQLSEAEGHADTVALLREAQVRGDQPEEESNA